MKIPMFGLLVVGVLSIFGCREYQLYQYKPVNFDMKPGKVFVKLVGMYGTNYDLGGKRKADQTYPYTLTFALQVPLDYEFTSFVVTDLEIKGKKSGKLFNLPDLKSGRIHGPDEYFPDLEIQIAKASIGNLNSEHFEYEDLSLQATVTIYDRDNMVNEKVIYLLLKTDFNTSSHSDSFDRLMSV